MQATVTSHVMVLPMHHGISAIIIIIIVVVVVVNVIFCFTPSVSRMQRNLETEKLEIENVSSDT